MKKFLLFFLGLFFFCVFSGRSQSVIKGIIKDENDKVVVSATISLLQTSDSAIVKFAISDKEGRYYFSAIKQGEYFIVASSAGFDKAYSSTFVLDKAREPQ